MNALDGINIEVPDHLFPLCYYCNNCEAFSNVTICHAYHAVHKDEKLMNLNKPDDFLIVFEECPFKEWANGKSVEDIKAEFFIQRAVRVFGFEEAE